MSTYPNSGEPDLLDLKGDLWRVEQDCWIDTGVLDKPFRIAPLPAPGEDPDPLAWSAERLATGRLIVRRGYICDGSSIPLFGRKFDDEHGIWPPTVHDIEYEAMRTGELPQSERAACDRLYADMERAFGASWLVSRLCLLGLRLLGGKSAALDNGPEYPHRHARAKAAA